MHKERAHFSHALRQGPTKSQLWIHEEKMRPVRRISTYMLSILNLVGFCRNSV